ncbi:DUF5947 family protein [Gordonia sp. SL306]|uniref:DUF5947 family protein n=1 Tax=Gordonia sp. SL306 TaxID=2995145 RepID=UPI002271C9DF|nr:DUF5947 family protein [Gordonia sp. SL306]WAC53712.1 DUF5947 family protein [Gordonia sp. SL306]
MTTPFDVIRRITTTRPATAGGERCEMCAESIGDDHRHVVNTEGRALMCVCRGCYLLFTDQGAALRYRAVPDRYLNFRDHAIDHADWESLEIPVNLAFFFRNSGLGRVVAFYPGAGGAIESDLSLAAWDSLVARNRALEMLTDDVEAVLIRMPERGGDGGNGDGDGTATGCLLLPIDVCYEFVGQVRMRWRGFDGGADVHNYMDEFFTSMSARARAVGSR